MGVAYRASRPVTWLPFEVGPLRHVQWFLSDGSNVGLFPHGIDEERAPRQLARYAPTGHEAPDEWILHCAHLAPSWGPNFNCSHFGLFEDEEDVMSWIKRHGSYHRHAKVVGHWRSPWGSQSPIWKGQEGGEWVPARKYGENAGDIWVDDYNRPKKKAACVGGCAKTSDGRPYVDLSTSTMKAPRW